MIGTSDVTILGNSVSLDAYSYLYRYGYSSNEFKCP